jgi:hypothetical protein
MDDPKKEKERMDYYANLTDIFFDLKYEKLSLDEPIKENWPVFENLIESLGKENLLKMLNAFKISVLDEHLKKETDKLTLNTVLSKYENIKKFIEDK